MQKWTIVGIFLACFALIGYLLMPQAPRNPWEGISTGATTAWCFQENATTATACGGLATGSYAVGGTSWALQANGSRTYDGDGSTYDWSSAVGDPSYLYTNYTKPASATNASLWNIAYSLSPVLYTNCSIPSGCWAQSPLQFRFTSYNWQPDTLQSWGAGHCYNGTGWQLLFNKSNNYKVLTEESIYWSMFWSTNATCNDTLNVNNTVYTMTANSSINGMTCFVINGKNITLNCNGYTITGNGTASTYGVNAMTGTSNITVMNCIIRNFSSSIYFNTVSNVTIMNVTANGSAVSGIQTGVNLAATSNVYIGNSNITGTSDGIIAQTPGCGDITVVNSGIIGGPGTNAYPVNQQAACPRITLINNTITSVPGYNQVAVFMMAANNTLTGNIITPSNAAGIYFYNGSTNNRVENNTVNGTIGAAAYGIEVQPSSNNSVIIGNNITGNATGVIQVSGYNNTFLLNRLNATNTSAVFINDTSGANFYNATYAGSNQGNIYANVLNGSVNVSGLTLSSFPGLYIGLTGTGFPYNNSTSAGKFICSFAGCGDAAPLTSQQWILINTAYGAGITALQLRPIHAFATNVQPVNQSASVPLFNVTTGAAGTYLINVSQTPAIAGFIVRCAPNYNQSGLLTLNATSRWIVNVTYPSWQGIWCWGDFHNPTAGLKYNITVVQG